MRPVKLIMSAFGSYAGEEIVDFSKVKLQDLFLISGDTGSGKTTIFDAITYALYDKTSGGKREGNMMRSQYAEDDVETYVEFTFSYREQIYTIRRKSRISKTWKTASGRWLSTLRERNFKGKSAYAGWKKNSEERNGKLMQRLKKSWDWMQISLCRLQ